MRSLLDYSAGRLSAPERSAVERHLDACIVCRTQAAEYGRALRLAATARQQPQPASQTSWHMLRVQLESGQTGQPNVGRPIYRLPGRWALAGALTAGAAGLLLWMPHHLSFWQSSSQVSLQSSMASSQKPLAVHNMPTGRKSIARDAALNTSQSRESQAVALRTSLLPVLRTKHITKPLTADSGFSGA